ncbi:fat protein [Apostichopus japonicus]|uniref:Fat protein n=1 Tax=Stichopus japonicus TaxID=307972 RepID=A0A2G8K1J7_STIJA|nr:fat protein [Apostichopus japonicus]
MDGLDLTLNQLVDYDSDLDITASTTMQLRCGKECSVGGSPNLIVKFNNLNDHNLTVSSNSGPAEVTELLSYTSKREEDPQILPSQPIYAIDFDRDTIIRYEIYDTGTPFKLVNEDNGMPCYDSKINADEDINDARPYLVADYVFDYEVQSIYNITIGIYSFFKGTCDSLDSADEVVNSTLLIQVKDLDNQPPVFEPLSYEGTVPENSKTFLSSPRINAFDQDKGIDETILYSLEAADGQWDCTSYVAINESTGILSITKEFDYEVHSTCDISIKAEEEDNDRQTAFAPLTIDIEDVNDECPTVVASSVKGVFVEGEPYVSDVDRQNWLTIRINDNDTELRYETLEITSQFFILEQCAGCDNGLHWIKVNESTAVESENITITVFDTLYDTSPCNADDAGATVIIDILVVETTTNILDPTFDEPSYYETIQENYEGFLLQVSATNSDGDNLGIEYYLDERDVNFNIGKVSGNISVIGVLDYEKIDHYNLMVNAIDTRWTELERSAEVLVNITITNVNDNPPVLEGFPATLYISESTPVGTTVFTVQATDRDADAVLLEYSLSEMSSGFPLEMDPGTGQITTKSSLDADIEGQREYNATVIVSDGEVSLISSLKKENVFISSTDLCHSAALRGKQLEQRVHLHCDTEVMTLGSQFKHSTSRAAICIRCDHVFSDILSEYGPIFPILGRRVSLGTLNGNIISMCIETIQSGTDEKFHQCNLDYSSQRLIRGITVGDLDYLEVNRDYVITSDGGSNVTINETSGTVYVYGPFDRERQSQFEFSLFVENTAQPRFRTTQYVVVKITDENDELPTFTDVTMSNCKQLDVTEGDVGLTPADPLCTFLANDGDEPGNENSEITYTVDNDEYFIMNNETGELSLQKALDRETNDSITIVVTASDNGKPRLSTKMSVSILIEGINDEKPMFQNGEYQTYVHEETAINTKIYTLNATDPDLPVGEPIYYKPRNPGDPVWETFYLNSVDGECEIYTLRPLEYSQTLYRLEIVTYDNDPSPYYSDVTEDDTALLVYVEQRISCDITADGVDRTIDDAELKDDVVITSVIAKSSCNGSEDEIMFLLDEETFFPVSGEISTSHYSIDEENGNIYAENVNNIDVGTYLLTVTAYNKTGSTLDQSTVSTEVFIIVNDTNNNCPYFDVKSYDARYMKDDPYLSSEMVPGWLVVFIGDINFSNSAFGESLVEGGEAERSFRVVVNSDVSHDTNLTVTVSDNDNNCTSEETIIFITVMSSLAPMFEDDNYIEYIPENMEAGDLVIQRHVRRDFCSFEGIDYETEMSYVLNVSATDGRWPEARTSFTDVLVMVEDINEYSPSFWDYQLT